MSGFPRRPGGPSVAEPRRGSCRRVRTGWRSDPEQLHPLADVAQADAAAEALHLAGIETAAVVVHSQADPATAALQVDDHAPGRGVALDVGQRLLDDAKQGDVHVAAGGTVVQGLPIVHVQAAALAEFLHQLAERGRQAEGVQQGRVQVVGDAADLADGGGQALGALAQGLAGVGLARAQFAAGQFELELDGHQQLADAVVQLA
ncbi:hypothetical protein BGI51_11045 [Pseudomonas oryzihabitans]|nr:hypothetical protein BGI51_11045 [Pseudomonas psychrotolerans]